MKFRDRDGVLLQDVVVCAQCGFESADDFLMFCPVDGAVLGEVTREVPGA